MSQVEKIFSLTKEQKNAIVKEANDTLEMYSIEKFYDNIMRVYQRAIRKYW